MGLEIKAAPDLRSEHQPAGDSSPSAPDINKPSLSLLQREAGRHKFSLLCNCLQLTLCSMNPLSRRRAKIETKMRNSFQYQVFKNLWKL